jgi:PleD family two-component response regulator
MLYHRAYGRDLETLVVAVIDNRRPMLSLMRGMLAAIGVGRIEARECPTEAFAAMSLAVPDLVIAASSMQPLTGAALVKVMRHALSGPLSLVPAMIMSARGGPALVEESLRAGAHQVLVLPRARSIAGSTG